MSLKKNTLLIATSKGLMVYKRQTQGWKFDQVHFLGMPVSIAQADQENNFWWVCLAHKHWGAKVHYSANQGKSWHEVPSPKYPSHAEVKPGMPATLQYIWSFANEPNGGIWLGTEPGGLFYSKNQGKSFHLVESLWNHPSRIPYWFGGGRKHPGIHSIVIDPRDSNHIYIAISCAGVFETFDHGQTWEVRNQGLRADFLPNPHIEVGQDPHLILLCSREPDTLWQQNHCGIFRSTDAGQNWLDVTDPSQITKYGFTIAVDENDPLKAWVIPATSDDRRVAVNQALCVYFTPDGGQTWQAQREGLPQEYCFDIVLRHSLDKHEDTLAFGTNIGNLFLSDNEGASWQLLNNYLPTIFSVRFA